MSRTESLFNAVALMSASAVFFRILFVAGRMPRERWWIGERWLCDVWVPIMLIGFSFSVDFVIAAAIGKGALFAERLPALYAAVCLAVAAATWILLGRLLPSGTPTNGVDSPTPFASAGPVPLPVIRPRPRQRRAA